MNKPNTKTVKIKVTFRSQFEDIIEYVNVENVPIGMTQEQEDEFINNYLEVSGISYMYGR